MQNYPSQMDYAKQDLDITKAQIDLFKNKPDNSKPLVTAIDDLQKRNQKRRPSLAHAALDGVMGALKYNAQSNELEQENRMNAILEQNLQDLRAFTTQRKREIAQREALTPYASAAIKLAHSGADPDTINANARTLFEMAADKGLVKGRFVSMMPNSTIAVIKGTDGKVQASDTSILAPEEAKLAQEERMKKLSLGIQQQNADAYGRSVNSSVDLHKAQIDQMPATMAVRQQGADTAAKNASTKFDALGVKSVKDIVPQLEAATFTEKIANDVIKDAEKHPDVFNNLFMNFINTGGDASSLNLLMQKTINPKERDAYMRISKNLNALMVSDVKSIGGANNMTIDRWIKESNPNMQFSKDNVVSIVTNIRDKAKFSKDLRREALGFPAGERIGQAYDNAVQNLPKQQAAAPSSDVSQGGGNKSSSKTILMIAPNGKVGPVEIKNIKSAMNDGLEPYNE